MKAYELGLLATLKTKKVIDADLAAFAEVWLESYRKSSTDAIQAYVEILLRGGKRLRGILAMQSYYAHGGDNDIVALGAARVLELVQAYLLVLDDIADKSDTRRGGRSAHRLIEQRAAQFSMKGDLEHYGRAQAVNAAQSGMHMAALELLRLPIKSKVAQHALMSLHTNVEVTGIGQIADLYNESTINELEESDIEEVLVKKTAYYTIVSPLELGACLAGEKKLNPDLQKYAIHTGSAFQINDDIISTFGDEVEIGKSSNDDIREGKMTLLAHYARRRANTKEKYFIEEILGNNDASDEACDQLRNIMVSTGALEYAKKRCAQHIADAHTALDNAIEVDPKFITFLRELSDYIGTRTS